MSLVVGDSGSRPSRARFATPQQAMALTFGKRGGAGQTAGQGGLPHAHRVSLPLSGEGPDRRGDRGRPRSRRAAPSRGTAPLRWRRAIPGSTRPRRPGWRRTTSCARSATRGSPCCARSSTPRSGMLAIRAPDGGAVVENALTEAGRARIGAFLAGYLGEEARGEPRFHYVPGPCVLRPAQAGGEPDQPGQPGATTRRGSGERRHRRRFRANVWFSGAPAWAEFDWVGQTAAARRRRAARDQADLPLRRRPR